MQWKTVSRCLLFGASERRESHDYSALDAPERAFLARGQESYTGIFPFFSLAPCRGMALPSHLLIRRGVPADPCFSLSWNSEQECDKIGGMIRGSLCLQWPTDRSDLWQNRCLDPNHAPFSHLSPNEGASRFAGRVDCNNFHRN